MAHDIFELYENTQLTLQQIADSTGYTYKQVFTRIKKNYSSSYRKSRKAINYRNSKLGELNPMTGKFGEAHHNYRGRVSDNKGYFMVLKPEWYTGRAGSKHVFEHSVVVCLNMGLTEIPRGWCVHHCDGITVNNGFNNLVLITVSDHKRLHSWLGASTISKESTLKWVETHGTSFKK